VFSALLAFAASDAAAQGLPPPAAPERLLVAMDRDPFEVSPQLREGNNNRRIVRQDGAALNQLLRLHAIVRGPEGGIAKIQIGKDKPIVVRDGDELDVGGIRYIVAVEADGLMLRGAGAPQYKMQVR
jgi:hypothetical protein